MTKQTLREILEKLTIDISYTQHGFETNAVQFTEGRLANTKAINEAVDKIEQYMLDVVGKDEPETDLTWQLANAELDPSSRNQLRAELRKAITGGEL